MNDSTWSKYTRGQQIEYLDGRNGWVPARLLNLSDREPYDARFGYSVELTDRGWRFSLYADTCDGVELIRPKASKRMDRPASFEVGLMPKETKLFS